MKLSQLSTEKAADILCEVSIYAVNVVTDEELMNEITKKLSAEDKPTKERIISFATDKLSKLLPLILKKHKGDIFGIIAAVNEKSIDDVAKQNIVQTMSEIREIINDKELVDFFKSCGSTKTE